MTEHTDELARARSGIVDAIEHLASMMNSNFKWKDLLSNIDLPASAFGRAEEFASHAGNWKRNNTTGTTPEETNGK